MSTFDYQLYYERTLPHFQPAGATLFLTYRLFGSLPIAVLQRLRAQGQRLRASLLILSDPKERARQVYHHQRYLFGRWDDALHTTKTGPTWLADPRIALLVWEAILHRDSKVYSLHTFCIMPNHVDMVFTPLPSPEGGYFPLSSVMGSLKGHTARQANPVLERQGQFWQHESYDHVVRDLDELERINAYVLNNPVKAGLVQQAEDWQWSYPRL